jgi:ribonuclease HI
MRRSGKTTHVIVPADGSVTVFTDGSSLPAPRRGGIAVRFVYTDALGHETAWDMSELGFPGATNNQMELLAVITALREIQSRRFPAAILDASSRIDIYTDSQYVANNIGSAMFGWPRDRWMTRDGRPVENADLWKDLVRELLKVRKIKRTEILWAKGHSRDNPHNAAVDKLAKESARRPIRAPLAHVGVRRKKTTNKVEVGSVEMRGQRLMIRIITAQYLPTQRVHKLRYEVMSRGSPFYRRVDFAYTTDPRIREGHTYRVRMNSDQAYPQIAKCFGEVVSDTKPGAESA